MLTIYEKFPKDKLATLPRVRFQGRMYKIVSESEADRAVDFLMQQPILGFDTETRPAFRRNANHQVALLQVATSHMAFLFRLNRIDMPDSVIRLLSDNTITKVGLSLKDDMQQLRKRRDFKPGTFIELQHEVKTLGIQDMSLQKIYANLFGEKIAKSQQLSNWEADNLSDAQCEYASIDAWACIQIFEKLQQLQSNKDFTLIQSPTLPNHAVQNQQP